MVYVLGLEGFHPFLPKSSWSKRDSFSACNMWRSRTTALSILVALRFSYGNCRYFAPQMCVFHMLVWKKNHADRRKKKSESRYRWSHIRIFSCIIGIPSSESYSFFHNHGSVENGYVWKVTIITEIRPCFTSIFIGGRVFWFGVDQLLPTYL